MSSKQIAQSNPKNSSELVTQTGLVIAQQSQQGGGSPIMRGFEASRILLVIDGVRLNNLIYRGGHLQNIITTDPSVMDHVDLLFGPSSTVYGSDALGGVIHFHTKSPKLSDEAGKLNTGGNAMLRYASASSEKTGHIDFNVGAGKLASFTSVSYSDFGDLLQGKNLNKDADSIWLRPYYVERINGVDSLVANENIYKQVQSAYSQYDILEKLLFKQNENISHSLNLQLSNSSDVPRYDRLTDPSGGGLKYAEWYYGPQFRSLIAYDLNVINQNGFFNEYHGGINYQAITESRHTRRFGSNALTNRNEDVSVLGFDIDARKKSQRNDLRIGIEATFNSLTSTAEETYIVTGEISALNTRYPDGDNNMNSFALYTTNTYDFNDHWVLNAGLRMEYVYLKSTFVSKEFYDFPYDEVTQTNFPLSGSLGIIWKAISDLRVSLLGSTGFRAPDVDDLAKVFESASGSVILPNPDLLPEKTFNLDLSITKIISNKVKIEAVGFYTLFNDAIVTDAYTYNGEDSILYDGEMSAVYANQNAGNAFIYGANANLFIDFNDWLAFTSTITYTYGRIVNDTGNAPLDHIPPVFGKTSLIYHAHGFRGELFAMYNGTKKIEDYFFNGEDNEQYATPEGMPGWFTLNLRLQYAINKNIMLQAACENILNANYRVFASGISAPARNFVVGLRAGF
ncbi:MAG: TonB-dependent receptor [Chitinophagales bacterium]|nr:TonB-dependent receptor [Chitinophagales bacterium]